MLRRWLLAGCVLGLAFAVLPAADPPVEQPEEQPLRLKKKEKPSAPAEKPTPKPEEKLKDEDPRAKPEEPDIDEKELLQKILKDSRKAEDRLANKEVDDATKQIQRDVLAGIDKLLEQANKPPQDSQQGGGGGGGQQPMKGQSGQQQAKGSRGQRGSQQARGQGQGQGQGQTQTQGQGQGGMGQGKEGAVANQGGTGGTGSTEESKKLAEIYKDIWGHLPESLRAEMNAYSREQFMDKYRDQLKRYYSTLSEKGRRE